MKGIPEKRNSNMILYTGAYTSSFEKNSLNIFNLDEEKGSLTYLCGGGGGKNYSFLIPAGKIIYAADDKENSGRIDVWRYDGKASLSYDGGCDLPGGVMCHMELWPGRRFISAANYMDGSVVVCALNKDGIPCGLATQDRHIGVGFDRTGRQDKPYIHFSRVTPDGNRLIVNDLGLDWSAVYRIDKERGTLVLDGEKNQVHLPGGQGPRHLEFSADGRFWYLVTEMGCRVFAYGYDTVSGKSSLLGSYSMLPEKYEGFNIASDIHLSPDGEFLYAASRGRDEIAVFHVDKDTGALSPTGRYDAHCGMPRTFAMTDKAFIIAGQASGKVIVLRRDRVSGALGEVIGETEVPGVAYVGLK